MDIRKTVTLLEEINSEYGARAKEPLRRVAIGAVFRNPLAGKAAGADIQPLIDLSLELGVTLTQSALATLGAKPAQLRSYTKAALVGTGGDLEHGAAMIHPRLGMAMRRTLKRGRVIIPGHAKVGPPRHHRRPAVRPPRSGLGPRRGRSTPGADPRCAEVRRDRAVDRLRHRPRVSTPAAMGRTRRRSMR